MSEFLPSNRSDSQMKIGWTGLALIVLLADPQVGQAQIRPDRSLDSPSQVQRAGRVTVITGGSRSGENLFHSFESFSLPRDGVASFRDLSPQVRRIFTRVTGSDRSRINGVIEALQTNGDLSRADFFLINPNGIQFGRHASLRLGGAFLATTATQVRFSDGLTFSAVDPQDAPLLRVSTPIGLQLTPASAEIQLQSRQNIQRDRFGDPIGGGLVVQPSETIALIGNGLTLDGGYLTAPGGQITLVSSAGPIQIEDTDRGWQFRPDGAAGSDFGREIRLQREAILNATNLVSGGAGGSIQLRGDQVVLTGGISVLSDTLDPPTNPPTNPPTDQPTNSPTNPQPTNSASAITIQATDLQLANFSLLRTATFGSENGGDVRIRTDRLSVRSGSELSTLTFGSGNAGDLTIRSRQSIELSGRNSVLANGLFAPTGLLSQVGRAASGAGGRVQIRTGQLLIQDGAAVATDTSGSGQAGAIQIQADQINLAGVLRTGIGAIVLDQNLPLPSGIFADSNPSATARGGNIALRTGSLSLREGAVIQTNAEGSGDAGNIAIRASERVSLTGRAGSNLTPTTIFAASGGLPGAGGTTTATGRGGTVAIQTPDLRVDRGAAIAVSSLNPDQQSAVAGNLRVQADRIQLSHQGQLSAITASGDGGNVNIQSDRLTLRQQSAISTTAGTEQTDGNGGNVTIATEYLLAAPAENSDITANAFLGDGGTVTLTAQGIIGIEPRDRPTGFSDITASSEFGASGQIIIRSPDVKPPATVSELPTTLLGDRPTQGCESVQQATRAEFFNTGRSGLPLSPYEAIGAGAVLSDLRLPPSPDAAMISSSPPHPPPTPLASDRTPSAWIEANRWQTDATGRTTLIATSRTTPFCSARSAQ